MLMPGKDALFPSRLKGREKKQGKEGGEKGENTRHRTNRRLALSWPATGAGANCYNLRGTVHEKAVTKKSVTNNTGERKKFYGGNTVVVMLFA